MATKTQKLFISVTHNYDLYGHPPFGYGTFQPMPPSRKLGCEWRVVVVNGKISSSSLYRQYGIVKPQRHIIPEVENIVMEAHSRFAPAPVYVVDVAQVGDEYKIIEHNTFNSAGLYNCDVGKIIDDVNSYVLQQM